jgi:hypothetical protein
MRTCYDDRTVVFAFVVNEGRITHIDLVANPHKLDGAGGL